MTSVVAALTAAQLAVFVIATYAGVVSIAGTGVAPSVGATAVIALSFDRVRRAARYLANRVVFGRRATPLEAVAQLSNDIARAPSDQVATRLAEILVAATTARQAHVWVRAGASWQVIASSGRSDAAPAPSDPGSSDVHLPIDVDGETVGALSLDVPAGSHLPAADLVLAQDLAALAAAVFRNIRLRAELQASIELLEARADELVTSRRRLVSAEDESRRRLERDIHDGGQQYLTALALRLGRAKLVVDRRPADLGVALDEIVALATTARDALADLAAGVHPRALSEEGLIGALRATGRSLPFPVEVSGVASRVDGDIAAAVHLVCSEALQNAAKHARPNLVAVRIDEHDGMLRFEVRDDGIGFAQRASAGMGLMTMRDRVEALGGRLEIRTAPGAGTTVEGWVPAREEVRS